MPTNTFLADLNLSPKTVALLCEAGWDVLRASACLPLTAADEELLELARAQGRSVITSDLDFSALLALGDHRQPSVVSLRLSYGDPHQVALRLLEVLPLLERDLAAGCVATVEDSRVRVRNLPMGR